MTDKKTEVDILFDQAHEKQQLGWLQEAETLYRQALALRPTVAIHNNLACVLKDQQRYDDAAVLFRKILAQRPHYAGVWYNLVDCHDYDTPDHDDVRTIKAQLDDTACKAEERMYLLFSLGKIYNDCDCYDEAFRAYAEANAIRNDVLRFDPAVLKPILDQYTRTFNLDFFSHRKVRGSPSKRPVFIVGLPRSGKSLLEKRLAIHPDIHGGGELSALDQVASRLGSYPKDAARLDEAEAETMAAEYLGEMDKRAPHGTDYVIDTMPGNFRHLGLIWQLFPNARVLHCVRDLRDTGLFTYFRCFQAHNIYAYDLEHIGIYYRVYRQFMEHWRAVLPMPVHEVCYETLVERPLETIDGVYRFLELEAPEPVQPAVPLYTRELGRWRCYERYLEPLINSLAQ